MLHFHTRKHTQTHTHGDFKTSACSIWPLEPNLFMADAGFFVSPSLLLQSTSKLGSIKRRGYWSPAKDGRSENSSTLPTVLGSRRITFNAVSVQTPVDKCRLLYTIEENAASVFILFRREPAGSPGREDGQTLLIRSGFMCKQRPSYCF